jgi:hypothetical protein
MNLGRISRDYLHGMAYSGKENPAGGTGGLGEYAGKENPAGGTGGLGEYAVNW